MSEEKDENYWNRLLLKIIFQEDFKKLEKEIRQKVKYKFLIPLEKGNNENLKLLYENDYGIPRESMNLLHQANDTLKNAKKLLKTKSIVDINTLIRSSFEYIMMGMMIVFDQKVYEEYKILNLKTEERNHTKIQKLINKFKSKLKEINPELFSEYSNRTIRDLMTDFYDKLCLYTHSSLVVNEMIEVKLNGDEDFFLVNAKQNIYFLKIILNSCLKYITKNEKYRIDYLYVFLSFILLFYEIDYRKYTSEYLQKYKDMMYLNINKEFFDNDGIYIDQINNMAREINEIIENNPPQIIEGIRKLLEV